MKNKPFLKQRIYSLNVGNSARLREQVLTEFEVVKVGRKFFYARPVEHIDRSSFDVKFKIEDWEQETEYTANHKLYTSKEKYEEEVEVIAICKEISQCFNYGYNSKNIDIQVLRKIREIIND